LMIKSVLFDGHVFALFLIKSVFDDLVHVYAAMPCSSGDSRVCTLSRQCLASQHSSRFATLQPCLPPSL
jgi:hypothetical protein